MALALAVFVSGCSPTGTSAFFKGKKCLDRGDYAGAVAQFQTATELLVTNASAWNYLGVACQRAGQPADAVKAYERALVLDRDLMEAHYNLGCLRLEQNEPDAAKTEFTAYTLRRPNAPEGWLKLGLAQLHAGETVPAEKSFSTALALSTNNPEAYNGLGLARITRDRPREAAEFFAAAIQFHPDFAPAYLNLAALNQEYLHDRRAALQNYRAYLALDPRPANWDEVNATANALERNLALAAVSPPPVSETKTQVAAPHPVAPPKPPVVAHAYSNPPPAQVVRVQPEPAIVTTPSAPVIPPVQTAPPPAELPVELPPAPEQKTGFFHRLNPATWFSSSQPEKTYEENGVTPLPDLHNGGAKNYSSGANTVSVKNYASGANTVSAKNYTSSVDNGGSKNYTATPDYDEAPAAAPAFTSPHQGSPRPAAPPVTVTAPVPLTFARYPYSTPHFPQNGNRRAAVGAFTQAEEFEQDSRWLEAMQSYQQAADYDPGWFEAQYNYGLLSYRLRDYRQSLAAYEFALAIQPESVDARYNFAQSLTAQGYVPDAVNELKKVLAAQPDAVRQARAHLALGNIYAQQLRDPALAREHYLKVLALDPQNPQATAIRFWLAGTPK